MKININKIKRNILQNYGDYDYLDVETLPKEMWKKEEYSNSDYSSHHDDYIDYQKIVYDEKDFCILERGYKNWGDDRKSIGYKILLDVGVIAQMDYDTTTKKMLSIWEKYKPHIDNEEVLKNFLRERTSFIIKEVKRNKNKFDFTTYLSDRGWEATLYNKKDGEIIINFFAVPYGADKEYKENIYFSLFFVLHKEYMGIRTFPMLLDKYGGDAVQVDSIKNLPVMKITGKKTEKIVNNFLKKEKIIK